MVKTVRLGAVYDEFTGFAPILRGHQRFRIMQPRFYLANTPRGVGVSAALFYVPDRESVYGWFTGARNHGCESMFFALEHYYAKEPTIFWRSMEDDVHGRWAAGDTAKVTDTHCPVPEAMCHELERLQSEFADEWLFFLGDPRAAREVNDYWRLGLPVGQVNVRSSQLQRFDQTQPTWTYASPGTDLNLVSYLGKHWKLDYRGLPAPV